MFGENLEIDYLGYGISAIGDVVIGQEDFRSPGTVTSFTFGVSGAFTNGESVGNNKDLSTDFNSSENANLVNGYDLTLTSFNALLGFRLNWLKAARPSRK